MKKWLCIVPAVLLCLCLLWGIGTGFMKNNSVLIRDWSVSDDGTELTLTACPTSSVGSLRKVTYRQQNGRLYLDFYAAFGGLNGRSGAGDVITVPLIGDTRAVAVRQRGGYTDVLVRDEVNGWQRELRKVSE